jgi:hypothetical protein
MRKALEWKRSRISMLEVEALLHRCIPKFQIAVEKAEVN